MSKPLSRPIDPELPSSFADAREIGHRPPSADRARGSYHPPGGGRVRWEDLETTSARLAEIGRERLERPGVVLVGTIRSDGSPRISPVEPFFWRGELWLPLMWQSMKAKDLARDPRVLVHSIVTDREGKEGEFKVRGTVEAENDRPVREQFASAVGEALGWQPQEPLFHLYRVSVEDVTFIRYEDGDQRVVRWPDRRHFVRRETLPTSVGEPEEQGDF